jgi:hypothetical protein
VKLTFNKCSDGSWFCKGEYDGKTRIVCAWTKKEAEKQVRYWFGDWSALNG